MTTGKRAVFMGTPDFAVASLRALTDVAQVTAVVTRPDKRQGRGMKWSSPAVKDAATELGIDAILQPTKIRTKEFEHVLRDHEPDFILVVAYGRILPSSIIHMPDQGCLNVHASLLPKWRGAAPIQWSLYHGETTTGVTLMRMEEGLDTGPIISTRSVEVQQHINAAALTLSLADLGAELVRNALPPYLAGNVDPVPQDDAKATLAPIIKKEDGRVNWSRSATEIHDQVRAFVQWPVAFTTYADKAIKLRRTSIISTDEQTKEPGTLLRADHGGIHVACGRGTLAFEELQLEGKRNLGAQEFVAGFALEREAKFI